MRAKVVCHSVKRNKPWPGCEASEELRFCAVAAMDYSKTGGLDENNTYAKYTPSAEFSITVQNPALFDKFSPGQEFYVDFIPVDGRPE